VRVTIAEARENECPLGFTPGQTGVEQHPEQDSLPPGWRNDPLRHEAAWTEQVLPGEAATWQMAFREQLRRQRAGPESIRFRAECTAVAGGKSWQVPVPVTVNGQAERELRQLGGPDLLDTVR
jgi:hypothetical protein